MTLFSEKEDLLAVAEHIASLDFVDAERIYLLGGSQGGLVTALAATELREKIRGIILYFPALCIPDNWRHRFDETGIPETVEFWGLTLGREFFTSMKELYPLDVIGEYKGPVLIIQGDRDSIVLREDSEKAAEIYENCRLVVLKGEGHGFSPEGTKKAIAEMLDFLGVPNEIRSVKADTRPYVDAPESYFRPCENGGTMTRIEYKSSSYTDNPFEINKDALIYLPHGYESSERDYNVFYLIHGGGGDSNEVFGGIEARTPLKNLLDNMIAEGVIDPLIVVAPTFYYKGTDSAKRSTPDARLLTQNFDKDCVRDLIPAVESSFRVKSGREHRAFGGFSMGSEATWNIFSKCLDEVKYFLPMSGDCWAVVLQGGLQETEKTVDYLEASVKNSAVATDDFCIYAATGDCDIAYGPMNTMLVEMARRTDVFRFSDTFENGNVIYTLAEGGIHTYGYCNHYIYGALPLFFK